MQQDKFRAQKPFYSWHVQKWHVCKLWGIWPCDNESMHCDSWQCVPCIWQCGTRTLSCPRWFVMMNALLVMMVRAKLLTAATRLSAMPVPESNVKYRGACRPAIAYWVLALCSTNFCLTMCQHWTNLLNTWKCVCIRFSVVAWRSGAWITMKTESSL